MTLKTGRHQISIRLAWSILAIALFTAPVSGIDGSTGLRIAPPAGQVEDNTTFIDANSVLMMTTNVGIVGRDRANLFNYDVGFFYPYTDTQSISNGTQTNSPLYSAGIWVGGVIQGSGERRVTVADYSSEYIPGPVVAGTFPADALTNPVYRTYKLYADSGNANPNTDFLEWPAGMGAPVDDFGVPIIRGDQTLWCVFNDYDTSRHTLNPGETEPLGLEIHQSTFAGTEPNNTTSVVLEYKIFNRNHLTIDSCMIGLFVDPDLGNAQDDMIGSDSAGSFIYCYNSTNSDAQYGATPPAVGVQLLAGPVVAAINDTADFLGTPLPDFRNLPVYAMNQYVTGADPSSADSSLNFLLGLDLDGSDLINPISSNPSRFEYSGDPVAGTGWLQPVPGDRAMIISAGPFTFLPGDSQCFSVRIAVGQGTDRLSSIVQLRSLMAAEPNIPTDIDDDHGTTLPNSLALAANYPNPFNPATSIAYSLPQRTTVRLDVINILGQLVTTLVDREQPAGDYSVTWDGTDHGGRPVASGIYFYRLATAERSLSRKMILMK